MVGLRDDEGVVNELKLLPLEMLPKLGVVSVINIQGWNKTPSISNLLMLLFRNGHLQFASTFWRTF
jgi:hypothetical protein